MYKFNANGGNMGGYSMRPLIFDEGKWEGPNGALTLVGNNGYGKSAEQQTYSYRTRKYRYIKYGNGKKELYINRERVTFYHGYLEGYDRGKQSCVKIHYGSK